MPPGRLPGGDVAGRHGADRPGAGPADPGHGPRRRHDPGPLADRAPVDGYTPARRPGGVGPYGVDGQHRGRHGADRHDSDRHAAHRTVAGRHGADDRGLDDRYEGDIDDRSLHGLDAPHVRDAGDRHLRDADGYLLDAGDQASARYDETGRHEPHDALGYGPGRDGSRYRADQYSRPAPVHADGFDHGHLDGEQLGYDSDETARAEYDDEYVRDEYARDEYARDEYDDRYDQYDDDDRTARLAPSPGGTGRHGSPEDDGLDAPEAQEPDREPRRARTGPDNERPSDERPARRRRWPWVVGGVAAAAVLVPIALAVLGGGEDQRGSSPAGSVAELGASGAGQPGTGQPGTAPTAGAPRPGGAPADADAPPPAAAEVTYEVAGSGSAGTITFGRGTAVTQVSEADLPWQRTAPAVEGPAEYTLSAAGGSGEVSCKILVDGAVIAEDTADGDYAAVSCSGRR